MSKRNLILIAIVAVLALVVTQFGWSRLDDYVPENPVGFKAPFRTMAEHNSFMQDKEWPYILRLESGESQLLYYGSWHTTDPSDPQIAQIKELWAEFDPTVAVTENRLGLFVGTRNMGIRMFAEFGLVASLAWEDDIPIYTLEPPWEVEVGEMKAEFPTEEVTLFYTLRVFLNERGSVPKEDIDALALDLLKKRGGRPGLEGSLPDIAALDTLWDERFADLGPWRSLPGTAIDPAANPTRLQKLATLANEVRDRHAARVILDLLAKGERVFGVSGGSHVVKQEPVIRAGI